MRAYYDSLSDAAVQEDRVWGLAGEAVLAGGQRALRWLLILGVDVLHDVGNRVEALPVGVLHLEFGEENLPRIVGELAFPFQFERARLQLREKLIILLDKRAVSGRTVIREDVLPGHAPQLR